MTREELIAYDRWLTENKWGSSEIITPEQAADLYLTEHPLPPAEGAEEIDDETIAWAAEHQCGTPFSERWIGFVKGAKWHRSLHAQRIADKMVSERLKNAPKNCPKAAQCAHVEGGMKCPPNVICPI